LEEHQHSGQRRWKKNASCLFICIYTYKHIDKSHGNICMVQMRRSSAANVKGNFILHHLRCFKTLQWDSVCGNYNKKKELMFLDWQL
jgi:hypothetical protein